MDPQELLTEAIFLAHEVGLVLMTEKTRSMKESLKADLATLAEKERERSMLMREKDQMLAMTETKEKLVASFLEADDNENFDDQKAMLDFVVALMDTEGGNGSNTEGFAGVYGGNIVNPENSQNLEDEGALVANLEGANSVEE